MTDSLDAPGHAEHILSELGLDVWADGEDLRGSAQIVPELYVPGTDCVRMSVFASWADVAMGLLCIDVFGGRVPVTLDLTVDLPRPASGCQRVDTIARIVKVGRSVAVAEIEFCAEGQDKFLAVGTAAFAAAPDTSLTLPSKADRVELVARHKGRLSAPLAERAGCERIGAGVASMARREDGLNASNTINGGLITLVAEEAVLSTTPGTTMSSLAVRYLRPARVGPIVATVVTQRGELARIEIRDTGTENRLAVVATGRTFAAASE